MAELVFFSPKRIALNNELQYHPQLQELMANHGGDEFEIKLAEIAAHLQIVLDGDYYPSDIDRLCEIMTTKLRASRVGIIV